MRYITLILAALFFVTACRIDDVTKYDSQAFFDRNVRGNRTTMKLQKCSSLNPAPSSVGVVACLDRDLAGSERRYVLIAPRRAHRENSLNLGDYLLSDGAVVNAADLKSLQEHLKSGLALWGSRPANGEGSFWTFSSSPMQPENASSDSVNTTRTTLEVYGSRLSGGEGLIVKLSANSFSHSVTISKKEHLQCLIDELEQASAALAGLRID
jgi:hypothetical protein